MFILPWRSESMPQKGPRRNSMPLCHTKCRHDDSAKYIPSLHSYSCQPHLPFEKPAICPARWAGSPAHGTLQTSAGTAPASPAAVWCSSVPLHSTPSPLSTPPPASPNSCVTKIGHLQKVSDLHLWPDSSLWLSRWGFILRENTPGCVDWIHIADVLRGMHPIFRNRS